MILKLLFIMAFVGWAGWIPEEVKLKSLLNKAGNKNYQESMLSLKEINILDEKCQIEMRSQKIPVGCFELQEKSEKFFRGFKLQIPDLEKICVQNAKKLNQIIKKEELDKIKKSSCYESVKNQNKLLEYAQSSAFFYSENK